MSGGTPISEAIRTATGGGEIRGLRRRFVLAISLLVALVLVAQAAVLALFGSRHLRREIEARAVSYATLAVGPACDAYQTYYRSGFSKFRELVLELVGLNPDLEELAIYDVEGRLLFRSGDLALDAGGRDGPGRVGAGGAPSGRDETTAAAGERLLAALRGLERQAWTDGGGGERRYLVVVPRVEEWGRHRYSVAFRFSYGGLGRATWGIAWRIGGLALLALAVGVAIAYLLSAQSLVPVARLTHGARRLAEGDLRHRIALKTGDEFEVLGATFDHMAVRLASTIEDLEASNERLNRLNEELRQLDRLKSDLLANVSHELRTPLTAIGGYVEAMREGMLGDIGDLQRRSLEVVERNIRRLQSMIDQLLSYSRVVDRGLEIELAPIDLGAVAEQVVEAVSAAQVGELEVRFECPPDLAEVYGDAERLGQVIENLLTNAVKFSPEGGRIDLSLRPVADGVELAVTDRGIGIPEELQEKIFDRFYQVDSSSRRHFGGIGLGLAIVREILDLHHSTIRVESQPGAGSTFRFTLPLAAERSVRLRVGEPGEDGGRPAAGDGTRVTIIDDDAGFVHQLAVHLSGRGFAVDTAATVEQGFATVRRVRPDVVMLDRLLPDGDGFDLLTRLKRLEATREIPVILATVRPEKALGMRLGAAAYLKKPLDLGTLEKTLAEVLAAADDGGEEPVAAGGVD
jgi:signal transduction histidine kinase/ActR/RegA family two-component response regulator